VNFLMVPGPPFPSMISTLLTKSGKALGKKLEESRTMALYSLAGATAETRSLSVVTITMIFLHRGLGQEIVWRRRIWFADRECEFIDCGYGILYTWEVPLIRKQINVQIII